MHECLTRPYGSSQLRRSLIVLEDFKDNLMWGEHEKFLFPATLLMRVSGRYISLQTLPFIQAKTVLKVHCWVPVYISRSDTASSRCTKNSLWGSQTPAVLWWESPRENSLQRKRCLPWSSYIFALHKTYSVCFSSLMQIFRFWDLSVIITRSN